MIRALILDLDGTVYRGREEVPGAGTFIRNMRARGLRCLFVTNRANRPVSTVCEHIRSYGIPCDPPDVLTTAQAAAEYVGNRSAFVIGEEGILGEFARCGIRLDDQRPDCVVVSFERAFNYERMRRACDLIRQGAEFIVTNPDAWLRMDEGIFPGTGALAASIEVGCGLEPVVIGKPERRLFDKAVRHLGLPREDILTIGDNLDTDIRAGLRAELRSALILTGVSTRADLARSDVKPTWVVDSYPELEQLVMQEHAAPASTAGAAAPVRTDIRQPAAPETAAGRWIRELQLDRHPEGGYFRETYRAAESIPASALPGRYGGTRSFATSIHFLLEGRDFSAFHRLQSDEVWHFHAGDGLRLHLIAPDGAYQEIRLGLDAHLQAVVPATCWVAAEPVSPAAYALVGCTVAPGFTFTDFELGRRADLHQRFPVHFALIDRLTR
ncbi:MAG: HAD-IIA family hydrolase [Lentisphaerae bacterium]|nr:HAD-IIA family hydrolase [Lentisphaerota bacterium]